MRYAEEYSESILFIAGLPKSGTSWLEKMLASYPGFSPLLIPEATSYELMSDGSHDYDIPPGMFSRFKDKLVVSKMHIDGSKHNTQIIHDARIRYVVLYRDLRDVAVSYYYYVRQSPWHPEYQKYHNLDIYEALTVFADELLVTYKEWVISWEKNRDPKVSLMLKYEDLLANPEAYMGRIADHFGLDSSPETIGRIVGEHSFKQMSGGREAGKENQQSFFRKGQAGDWKNHFDRDLKRIYQEKIGDFLLEHGYE